VTLSEVCAIQTGFTARGRLDPAEHGNVLALQLRDVASGGSIDLNNLTRIRLDPVREKYLVRSGDVVFRSRGESTTAAVIGAPLAQPALAVLPLIILRPNPDVISGAYLAWAINQEPAQRHFEESAQGTSLRMVSRSSLENLKIAVPSLETQQRILQIDALAREERDLAQQLTHVRHELIRHLLFEQASKRTSAIRTKGTKK
jgi:Type I restriction modification DNA specificity domain